MKNIMNEYEKLLESAYKNIQSPAVGSRTERFEIPNVEGHVEGKKTIITNFASLASHFRRKPEHLCKFLLKELAASGQCEGERLVINIRIPSSKINSKIEAYAKEFVICKECGKPDTEILKEDRINTLHCLACGAKHPIRAKI
jgi:translation initiation factor 2 subunit 2